ncbi:hypothetical protein LINPERPRIM_LOCUS16172, partial [Linum perenne]
SILARLVRNTKPADEFEYDFHEINCYCGVRSSRRISRDPPNTGIKYFGCGNDHKGCGYFIWFEDKVAAMDDKVAPGNVGCTCTICGRSAHMTGNIHGS